MPSEFVTVTISLPELLLKLGQLRAKGENRSFSSYATSLLRADVQKYISALQNDVDAEMQWQQDAARRAELRQVQQAITDLLEGDAVKVKDLILAESNKRPEPGTPPKEPVRYTTSKKKRLRSGQLRDGRQS